MAKIYEKCENPGDGIQASPGHPGDFLQLPPPEIHAAPFICCSHTKIDCFDMWLIFGVAEMWLIFCVRLRWDHRLQIQNLFMAFKRVPL